MGVLKVVGTIVAVLAVYVLLQRYVLPMMGIST